MNKKTLSKIFKKWVYQARLVGGSITNIKNISFWTEESDLNKLKESSYLALYYLMRHPP
jgi:CRISPR-associated protein Csy2